MGITKTLGGDRIGAGKKQKVHMHGYERSSHDLGYVWRSTMAAGTLVPFMSEVALPGDTFDIDLDAVVKTHPTIGPLFGSFKVQIDVYEAPIRLYQGRLHNNELKIGMNMSQVKLPLMKLYAGTREEVLAYNDLDNAQINPSCILAYLGIRGIGIPTDIAIGQQLRRFNAVPYLAYWEIYKNYYSNKQEEVGYVIHTGYEAPSETVDSILISGQPLPQNIYNTTALVVNYTGAAPTGIVLNTSQGQIKLENVATLQTDAGGVQTWLWNYSITGNIGLLSYTYINVSTPQSVPKLVSFPLSSIDDMRNSILAAGAPVVEIGDIATAGSPYQLLLEGAPNGFEQKIYLGTQEGLAIKTYQSDLFNNWLSTEWIDGVGGINDITAIDTSGGSFNIDTLNISKKVYDMLNRIAVSGGTYDDWQEVTYDHAGINRAESAIYHGGLSKELVFQEVVSNSQATGDGDTQPLGTLAGKGVMGGKKKGGKVTIKVREISYIIGIISLTPRVDYSQGNKWDTHLLTVDDFHKPALDEIGFQELITEQMAWWSTEQGAGSDEWAQLSAGKQPAWINYMTNVNVVRGNFAIQSNEMFMTLNRRYEYDESAVAIKDLTTYIDPVKYNNIFAQTSLDAQNFWVQIAVDITARRKMSAKIMPNL